MEITTEIINKLADLAKLEFSETETENLKKDMSQIISYIEKMNELDTENVEPLIFMTEETNVLRKDEVKTSITKAEALQNAASKDSDYFRVPKFIEK